MVLHSPRHCASASRQRPQHGAHFPGEKKRAPKARTPAVGVRTFGALLGSGKWTPFWGLSPHSHSSVCLIPQASALPPSSTSHSNGTSTSTNYHSRHETVMTRVQRPCRQHRPPAKTSAVRLCTSGQSQASSMRAKRLLARRIGPHGCSEKMTLRGPPQEPGFSRKKSGPENVYF